MDSFDQINKLGEQIKQVYYSDDSMTQWFEENSKADEFPDELIDEIKEYLISRDRSDLVSQIEIFLSNEIDVNNIYNGIFYEFTPTYSRSRANTSIITHTGSSIDEEEEEEEDNDTRKGKRFFQRLITNIQQTLCVSSDISYLLLKKYHWNINTIVQKYFSSQDNLFQSINIHKEPGQELDLSIPFSQQITDKDPCIICEEEENVFRLYCGHKICQNCMANEIEELLKESILPVCRMDSNCRCEIPPSIVELLVTDQNLLKKYENLVLDSEIEASTSIRKCPCCKAMIDESDDIGCHTGKCPKCGYYVCIRCKNPGSHAPLVDCENVSKFTITIKNEMQELKHKQELWEIREEKLKQYRSDHKDEFIAYFDGLIEKARVKCAKEEQSEKEEKRQIEESIQRKKQKIAELKNKLSEVVKSNGNVSEISSDIEKYSSYLEQDQAALKNYTDKMSAHAFKRHKYMKRMDKMKEHYMNAMANFNNKNHDYFIKKYKEKVTKIVDMNLMIPLPDIEEDNKMTKNCPHCGIEVYKNGGCNCMTCERSLGGCGKQFCWVCNSKWGENGHGDHFQCPKYARMIQEKISAANVDISDPKFYPPPMGIEETIQFAKYAYLNSMFLMNKEKCSELSKKFASEDESSIRKYLLKEFADYYGRRALMKAEELMSQVSFAQSVLTWGYPQLYFMQIGKESSDTRAQLFEFRLYNLEAQISNFLSKIREQGQSLPSFCEDSMKALKNMIDGIFWQAEGN